MARKPRHFIYDLYLALADANSAFSLGLTQAQGRERIKAFLPNFADLVDPIIDASGDLSRVPPEILQRTDTALTTQAASLDPTENLNARLREASGRFVPAEAPPSPATQAQRAEAEREARLDGLLDKYLSATNPTAAPASPAQPEAPKPRTMDDWIRSESRGRAG